MGEDGKPVELGRGAMGVLYKAVDINLSCPVALKVINERYLGDESARLALCAKPGQLPRVLDIRMSLGFILPRNRGQRFYAMELVEGETPRISSNALDGLR